MDFDKYQHDSRQTAVYPRPLEIDESNGVTGRLREIERRSMAIVPVMYCALGLAGEAGEVAEQVKKSWRNAMEIGPERKAKIRDELGDVLWYVSNLATELGMSLDDIATLNIQKLAKRQEKGGLKKA